MTPAEEDALIAGALRDSQLQAMANNDEDRLVEDIVHTWLGEPLTAVAIRVRTPLHADLLPIFARAAARLVRTGESVSEDAEVFQADIRKIMEALGMSTHARPISAHEVVATEVLPRIKEIREYPPKRQSTGQRGSHAGCYD